MSVKDKNLIVPSKYFWQKAKKIGIYDSLYSYMHKQVARVASINGSIFIYYNSLSEYEIDCISSTYVDIINELKVVDKVWLDYQKCETKPFEESLYATKSFTDMTEKIFKINCIDKNLFN